MKYLSEISKIIDRHRAEVVITCEKTCWCWDVEAAICGHEEVASQSGVEADAESRDDLEEQFSLHEWIPGGIDK